MNTVMRMVTKGEAERLTERIKLTIESIDTSLVKLRNLVDEAQNSNTWQMLGFASWTAYVASLFEGRKVALGREDRQTLTTMLADQGMSTRAIAPIVGASQRTVANDVSKVAHLESDAPKVTGLDGKTYGPAESKEPRRRPITDQAREKAWKALKAVESLERITTDDRFIKNISAIEDLVGPEINRIVKTAAGLRRRLNFGNSFGVTNDLNGAMGTTIALSVLTDMIEPDQITPDQAAAALDVLDVVKSTLQRAAQRSTAV